MKRKAPQSPGAIAVLCQHSDVRPVGSLKPHPRNPNTHPPEQIKAFAATVQKLGWRRPIVVSKRSGYITRGHGQLMVAQHLKQQTVPVDLQDYASEAEEYQDMLADNRLAELSERDDTEVLALLMDLEKQEAGTEGTGYSAQDIRQMLDRLQPPEDRGDPVIRPEAAAKLQKKWKVKLGDVWTLGGHRIVCGDSTSPETWKRLMQGERAQLVHVDPPYGVGYEDSAGISIQNDKLTRDALSTLVRDALRQAAQVTTDDAAFYVWHASSTRRDFEHALDQVGLVEKQYITWVKDSFTLGRADYHWQTEPCFYAEKAGQKARWYGDRTESTVWRLRARPQDGTAIALASGLLLSDGQAELYIRRQKPKSTKARHIRVSRDQPVLISDQEQGTAWEVSRDPKAEYLHPTQKPVDLAGIAITNSSAAGQLVVDCFGGSFSTLLACEQLGRSCRAVDIDPKFVAVGLERWSNLTGKQPTRAT